MTPEEIKTQLELVIGRDCTVTVNTEVTYVDQWISVDFADGSKLYFTVTGGTVSFESLNSANPGLLTHLCIVLPEYFRQQGVNTAKVFSPQSTVFEKFGFEPTDSEQILIQDISGSPTDPCPGEAYAQSQIEDQSV